MTAYSCKKWCKVNKSRITTREMLRLKSIVEVSHLYQIKTWKYYKMRSNNLSTIKPLEKMAPAILMCSQPQTKI